MGIPANNTLGLNDLESFQPSVADVFVDTGVTNTLIVEWKGTVVDRGAGTIVTNAPRPRAEARVQRRP